MYEYKKKLDFTFFQHMVGFGVPLHFATSSLVEDLRHLWGSERAVVFGQNLLEFYNMELELYDLFRRVAITILENAECNDRETQKSKIESDYNFNKRGIIGVDCTLFPSVRQTKLLFIKTSVVGMNKEKASVAMRDFNFKIVASKKELVRKINNVESYREFVPDKYEEIISVLNDFKNRFDAKLDVLNNLFEDALNNDIDNPNIGKFYIVKEDSMEF